MSGVFKRTLTNLTANNKARFVLFFKKRRRNKTVKKKLIMFMIDLYKEVIIQTRVIYLNVTVDSPKSRVASD